MVTLIFLTISSLFVFHQTRLDIYSLSFFRLCSTNFHLFVTNSIQLSHTTRLPRHTHFCDFGFYFLFLVFAARHVVAHNSFIKLAFHILRYDIIAQHSSRFSPDPTDYVFDCRPRSPAQLTLNTRIFLLFRILHYPI